MHEWYPVEAPCMIPLELEKRWIRRIGRRLCRRRRRGGILGRFPSIFVSAPVHFELPRTESRKRCPWIIATIYLVMVGAAIPPRRALSMMLGTELSTKMASSSSGLCCSCCCCCHRRQADRSCHVTGVLYRLQCNSNHHHIILRSVAITIFILIRFLFCSLACVELCGYRIVTGTVCHGMYHRYSRLPLRI